MKANPAESLLPRMSVAAILDDAAINFGLGVDQELRAAWRRLVELVNELDIVVDGMDVRQQQDLLFDVAVSIEENEGRKVGRLGPRTLKAVEAFDDALFSVGLETGFRLQWCKHFRSLAVAHSVGHQIAEIDGYVRHRIRTGHLLGLMFADLVPSRHRTHSFDDFACWSGRLGSCAELVDSFWDLPQDHRRGHSAVRPNHRSRLTLAGAARIQAPFVLRPLPVGLRLKLAAKVLLMGANRTGRLNRLRTAP